MYAFAFVSKVFHKFCSFIWLCGELKGTAGINGVCVDIYLKSNQCEANVEGMLDLWQIAVSDHWTKDEGEMCATIVINFKTLIPRNHIFNLTLFYWLNELGWPFPKDIHTFCDRILSRCM